MEQLQLFLGAWIPWESEHQEKQMGEMQAWALRMGDSIAQHEEIEQRERCVGWQEEGVMNVK